MSSARLPSKIASAACTEGTTGSESGVTTVADHEIKSSAHGVVTVTLSIRMTGPMARLVNLFYAGLTRRYVQMEASGLKQRSENAARLESQPA